MTRQLFRLSTLLGLVLSIASAWADQLTGRVVGVADGDTLTVLTAQRQQHRVHLSGIDAPERRQAFGQVSKQHLSDLAYDKTVSVVFHKRDRYQRILGKVLVNGTDAGLHQIQSGLAWHYKRYEREQSSEDRLAYARAEETARAERRGLWRDPRPVAPWEFRRHRTMCGRFAITTARFNRIETTPGTTNSAPATTSLRRGASRSSASPPKGPTSWSICAGGSSRTGRRRRPSTAPSTLAPRP